MPQELNAALYDSFSAVRTHLHSNGLAMMPTAGLFPQAASVVALHGGIDYDIVVGTAVRQGRPPQMPSSIVTSNPNRVFLQGGRWGNFPPIDVKNVYTYSLGVWYIFGILAPEGLASDFMLGNCPFPGIQVVDPQTIPSSYFRVDLINQLPTMIEGGLTPQLPPLLNPIRGQG